MTPSCCTNEWPIDDDWPSHASHFGSLIQTWKHLDDLAGGAPLPNGSSIIDQQVIYGSGVPLVGVASSQTAGNPSCPPGYAPVDTDLSKDAGGTYSYLCIERATSTTGGLPLVLNVSAAVGSGAVAPACPQGWAQQPANLKAGTAAHGAVNLCVLAAPAAQGASVATGLVVARARGLPAPWATSRPRATLALGWGCMRGAG